MNFKYTLETFAGLVIAGHALAASSGELNQPYAQYVQASQSKVTIGQAILIAEKEVGGEAVEAELEDEDGRVVYDVDVSTPDGTMEVFIDSETGTVLSVGPDD